MTFPSEKYGKSYWDEGIGSNYGGKNPAYTLENYMPNRQKLANKIISKVGLVKASLSIGCGRGFLPLAFKRFGIDAYGLDISEYAIETAPTQIKDKLFLGDISDNYYMMNEFPISSFDLVTAIDVLEHIKVPQLYNAIYHTIRLSKRHILINMPVKSVDDEPDESETSTDSTHVSIYTPLWWITTFLKIGTPLTLELRDVNVTKDDKSHLMFARFEKLGIKRTGHL